MFHFLFLYIVYHTLLAFFMPFKTHYGQTITKAFQRSLRHDANGNMAKSRVYIDNGTTLLGISIDFLMK